MTANLIISTFNQSFDKYLPQELVIGRLAHTEFKDGIKKGDEVDVIMPAMVTLADYDGKSELADAEEAKNSTAKVRCDRGKSVHFFINDDKKYQIENAPDLKQKVTLAKEFSSDAVNQFAGFVDSLYGGLYSRAGYQCNNSGSAYTLSHTNAKEILAYMQAKFKDGDGMGHSSWYEGQMIAILPPAYQFYLTSDDLQYTESGRKELGKGYIGNMYGWDILCSSNIYKPSADTYMPLFGVKGKTLAGGVSRSLKLQDYVPDKKFDTHFKGKGYAGAGAPRADIFGAAYVSAPMSITTGS